MPIIPLGVHFNIEAAEVAEASYLKAAGWRSFEGHPPSQGSTSQQPWKEGDTQVNHFPALEHCTYGQYDESFELESGPHSVPNPAARKSSGGQPFSLHGLLAQHPRKVGD